jgi:hypothetical protein
VRGNVIGTRYGNDIVDGETESNSDRDFTLYEEAIRPRWEFNPDLFFFSDISFNQRDYPTAAFTDGLNRTSNGERYRFGLSSRARSSTGWSASATASRTTGTRCSSTSTRCCSTPT